MAANCVLPAMAPLRHGILTNGKDFGTMTLSVGGHDLFGQTQGVVG